MRTRISIIIPALNESAGIGEMLQSLQDFRHEGHEVIVVDGGSRDETARLAAPLSDRVMESLPGRARQMNAGARQASNEVLLFLHADTRLPATATGDINAMVVAGHAWGRFDVRIVPEDGLLRIVAWMMNLRSRLSGIATGDQAIFVKRELFTKVGGYPDTPLMEDLLLSDRLKQDEHPACIRARVTTSARRWQQHGRIKTILKMWCLRLAFRLGVSPARLARFYG